jgi:general secretion pathway protein G
MDPITNAQARQPMRTRPRLGHILRCAHPSRGWTLIELLVVLSLILILSSMAMTQYRNSIVTAREATLKSNLFIMRDAISQYYADKARYPESLQTLVAEHYIREVPKDPVANTTEWATETAPTEPGQLSSQSGIYDVKSTATGTSLDGTPYSEF